MFNYKEKPTKTDGWIGNRMFKSAPSRPLTLAGNITFES
jgi:hypothetical protein